VRAVENYFNYFTEIEECFRRCRGTPTLLSTLDWALIESWKEAGLPLEAVLSGIERQFARHSTRPRRYQKINSLAYCAQEVLKAAEEARTAEVEGGGERTREAAPPFAPGEVEEFLGRNAQAMEAAARRLTGQAVLAEDLSGAARELASLGKEPGEAEADLENLERRLAALEEKLHAALTRASSVELLAGMREEVERGMAAYRRKMSSAQIEQLERQFLKKRLFEHYGVPRLSLFYL
jgi:hypothetical protein